MKKLNIAYGDISPSTQFGRFIAALLMLTGIGTIGMVTSSISVYFIRSDDNPSVDVADEDKISILRIQIEDLSNEEVTEVSNYIGYLKSKR